MQNNKYINSIKLLKQIKVIDLRPVSSFNRGHIPNSVSFPVLNNLEISQLKKSGFASNSGREIVALSQLKLEKLKEEFKNVPLALVCQDGGIVSKYIWETLRTEQEVYVFKGGYKAYRRQSKQLFSAPYNVFVLCGKTGCGKTDLIEILQKNNTQTIHLEKLAGHAGSVFGNLENKWQPTQEQFENNLAFELQKINMEEPLVLEYEKANIGKVSVPKEIIEQIDNAKAIYIETNLDLRINRLVNVYANINDENLKLGIEILKGKLGEKTAELILKELSDKNYATVAHQLLTYFDNTKSYAENPFTTFLATLSGKNIENAAIEIVNIMAKKKRPPKGTLL